MHQTAAPTLTDHLAGRRLSAMERSSQIHRYHPVPIFGRALKDASKLNDPGIVHQDVYAIKVFNASGNDCVRIFSPAHISTNRFGTAASCAYLTNRLCGTRNILVRDENCRALLSKTVRNPFADSARPSGYYRYLSFQSARYRLDCAWQGLAFPHH